MNIFVKVFKGRVLVLLFTFLCLLALNRMWFDDYWAWKMRPCEENFLDCTVGQLLLMALAFCAPFLLLYWGFIIYSEIKMSLQKTQSGHSSPAHTASMLTAGSVLPGQSMSMEQYAQTLIARYNSMRQDMDDRRLRNVFIGAKASLLGVSSLSVKLRKSMLQSYRLAEKELFGKVEELQGEQELLNMG